MWHCIPGTAAQIRLCEQCGATSAALVMAYVGIDCMAYLSMPAENQTQKRQDFIDWVDKYLVGHPDQIYKYRGIDVYGARCAMLHSYGSKAAYHQQNPNTRFFAYHDGGRHLHDQAVDPRMVLIGTASFLNDVCSGMGNFMEACEQSLELRQRVAPRLANVLNTIPVPHGAQ
jgi:hypothetical protein